MDSDAPHNKRLLVWMVLAALAIRLAVVPFVYGEWMQPYFVGHWEQGNVSRALLAGQGFGSPFPSVQPSAIMPPVYPLIVAGIFKVFGIHTRSGIVAALSLNCLFSALACVPVYRMARRSFGFKVARWAGWAWAFSPYGIYFSAEWAWSTHLLLLCLMWLLYLSQDLDRSSSIMRWAGFGLLGGFAALTDPSILIAVFFLMTIAVLRLARAHRVWLLPASAGVLILIATISPWVVREYVVFHRLLPLRDSMGLELWLGNNGFTHHWVNSDHHPNHDAAELAEYDRGELAYMDHKKAEAYAWIRAHPAQFCWLSLRRAGYLWTGYWSFDRTYLAEEPMDVYNVPVATALSLLGLAGLVMAWRRHRGEAVRYGGVLVLLPMLYYFAHPEPYHMRPLDPLLAMLGCCAVHCWVSARTKRENSARTEVSA